MRLKDTLIALQEEELHKVRSTIDSKSAKELNQTNLFLLTDDEGRTL